MDILVGTAIGAILIFAAVTAIGPALQTNSQAANVQTAAWLATGMLNDLQTWSNGSWHGILALATGTTQEYYLNTSSSPYTVASGIQSLAVGTSTYWRYFYVTDVFRDSSGNIVSGGGYYDPSTKQVTVAYGWNGGPTSTVSEYLTRNQLKVYSQVNWTSGPSSTAVVSTTNFLFASSSNINYTGTPGAIKIGTL